MVIFLRQKTVLQYWVFIVSLVFILVACSSDNQQSISLETLPTGDPVRGQTIFSESINGTPACSTCHQLDDSVVVGPGLKDYGSRAGGRVEGMSAEEYTLQSIVQPATYIVPGFSNVMYNQFAARLTPQDIADLVAYLHTL